MQTALTPEMIYPWVAFSGAFAVAAVTLTAVVQILLGRLKKVTEIPGSRLSVGVVSAIKTPLRVVAIFASILIALQFAPSGIAKHKTLKMIQQAMLIFLMAWVVTRFLRVWLLRPEAGVPLGARKLIYRIVQIAAIALTLLMVLEAFGISVTPLLASLGVGSVAIALALQDTLSNLFAGFYLQLDEPIREGDFVRLEDGTEGRIEQIGWRSTKLRLTTDNIMVIPNGKLASSPILNYDLVKSEASVVVPMGVSYNEDLSRVERVTLEVAKETMNKFPEGVNGFEPQIRFRNFGDSAVEFNVILRVCEIEGQFRLRHEFIKAVHRRFKIEGIEVPFPQRVLHIEGGSRPKTGENTPPDRRS